MELLEQLWAGTGMLGAFAWVAIALRAAWLLPDWLAKWQRVLAARRGLPRSGAEDDAEP